MARDDEEGRLTRALPTGSKPLRTYPSVMSRSMIEEHPTPTSTISIDTLVQREH